MAVKSRMWTKLQYMRDTYTDNIAVKQPGGENEEKNGG